jgi:N-dimethylarginine dimethylaminohydrolase
MKININNEYGRLRSVLLASIKNFKIDEPINITQKYYYENDPPKLNLLIKQQNAFIDVLNKFNVLIHWSPEREDSPLQFNTRDVAFCIGDKFFISRMKENIRKNEHLALEEFTKELNSKAINIEDGLVEGGDIMIYGDNIYTGLSERTNENGFKWLVDFVENKHKIIPIKLKESFLHLDVVFNIISEKCALVYPPAIEDSTLGELDNNFHLLEVNEEEQFYLGTNVLSLGDNYIICDKRNEKTIEKMNKYKFESIKLDFSEVTKIGGSFRCATCPLERT